MVFTFHLPKMMSLSLPSLLWSLPIFLLRYSYTHADFLLSEENLLLPQALCSPKLKFSKQKYYQLLLHQSHFPSATIMREDWMKNEQLNMTARATSAKEKPCFLLSSSYCVSSSSSLSPYPMASPLHHILDIYVLVFYSSPFRPKILSFKYTSGTV